MADSVVNELIFLSVQSTLSSVNLDEMQFGQPKIWQTWVWPKNTTLMGIINVMSHLLFILFGFSFSANIELETDLLVWSIPNKSNRRSAYQWYFPIWWVYAGLIDTIPKW